MKEGFSRVKCLLGVELFEISENFIFDMRESHERPDTAYDFLPEFTINDNKGEHNQPVKAEYFHQFVGFEKKEDPKKYIYFRLATLDGLLQNEIDNSGIEDLFKDFDFKYFLSTFVPNNESDIHNMVFPKTHYLIVHLCYETTYDNYSGGYECELDISIAGYLDGNLEAKYYDLNKLITKS